jgi:hypothetical protein
MYKFVMDNITNLIKFCLDDNDLHWDDIIDTSALQDFKFKRQLANLFLSIKTPSTINITILVNDVCKFLTNPFNFESSVDNCKLYFEYTRNYLVWDKLYKEILDTIPFKSDGGKIFFGTMNNYFYKIFCAHVNPEEAYLEFLNQNSFQ